MKMGQGNFLRGLFDVAVAAADPARCVPAHLPPAPPGRTLVVGAGKAAASMARAVEDHWPEKLSGLVITRYGHGVPCDKIEVVEAAHPVPDNAGLEAARRILAMVEDLREDDLVLCLISGGGSALMSVPAPGVVFEDKQAINAALLRSGATISEINCVRKHLSAIKGGRLALAAAPAPVLSLLISDVPGDDPAIIASGPTVADPTGSPDALEILDRYRIGIDARVRAHLSTPQSETPKPGDPRLRAANTRLIATSALSLDHAATMAREAGYGVEILGDAIEGEAREVGRAQAEMALEIARGEHAIKPPAVLLSGGETTVTIKGDGRGGRNAEFALALAHALDGAPGIHAIACDTDGIDGSEDNAGAVVTPDTLSRAAGAGRDRAADLENNDAYGFFAAIGDLVITGPTRTNVNDFRAIVIES